MSETVRILIADDHAVVREGTRALVEREPFWEVCGVAANGREAVDRCLELEPHVLVLDLTMSDLSGLEVVRTLKRQGSKTEVLIFSAHQAGEVTEELFEAGAKSYIRKADAPEHLIAAIRSLSAHKPYFTPEISELLFARFQDRGGKSALNATRKLSARELELVRLLAEGKSNKEAATALGISLRTVETHRATIMRKLDIDSIAGLVRYALRNGIVGD